MDYSKAATDEIISQTAEALTKNGFNIIIAETGAEAKAKALELIPKNGKVMTMSSVTLDSIGLTSIINESGNYNSVKNQLGKMDKATQGAEMHKLGTTPEYAIGSVHAVTQDGKVLVSSNTGSQLPAYAYGSAHVIWIVGAQKIVPDLENGHKRIWEYVLPLETVRARKAYGLPETWISNPSKIMEINREVTPDRINIIFVKEVLGF
jgi:L-lactate utilization protein LutB